jgi:CubicO group peptidase (beta-lactamase class C family)
MVFHTPKFIRSAMVAAGSVPMAFRSPMMASYLLAMFIASCAVGCHRSSTGVAPPLFTPRPEIPIARKIPELDRLIRSEMARDDLPGLAIALIHDNRVVWNEGYGVANSFTSRVVLADTPFEAASIGKPVTAYAALKLVEEGRLDLHKPLSSYLTKQFVAPSPYRDEITARHVLTHTSGLSNNLLESIHEVGFKPGSRFAYSGVGFMYLQRVIESITHQPFNAFMTHEVFAQLGMGSTSYLRAFGDGRIARGHVYLLGFALPMPFAPIAQPNAANLLCSSASDLAKFAIELMNPRFIDKDLVAQMLIEQVQGRIGEEPVSWGVGIGLVHTSRGTCFWQWGDNVDFESYLVACPDAKMGVVVLTNSSRGRIIAREIGAKALGE